jgi:glycolate oxidase FAD binding subunit
MRDVLGAGTATSDSAPAWWGTASPGERTVIRVSFWAAALPGVLDAIDTSASAAGLDPAVAGSAAAGVLHASLPPGTEPGVAAKFVAGLREALAGAMEPGFADGAGPPARASAVVVSAPAAVRDIVDMWGPVPALSLMRALKDQFDPGHLMAPGRFAGGL